MRKAELSHLQRNSGGANGSTKESLTKLRGNQNYLKLDERVASRVVQRKAELQTPTPPGWIYPHLLRVENTVILCVSEAGSKDAGCGACADCGPSLERENWIQRNEAGPRACGSPSGLPLPAC